MISELLLDLWLMPVSALIGFRRSFLWLKTMKSGKVYLLCTVTLSTLCPSNLMRQSISQHSLLGQLTSFVPTIMRYCRILSNINTNIREHIVACMLFGDHAKVSFL